MNYQYLTNQYKIFVNNHEDFILQINDGIKSQLGRFGRLNHGLVDSLQNHVKTHVIPKMILIYNYWKETIPQLLENMNTSEYKYFFMIMVSMLLIIYYQRQENAKLRFLYKTLENEYDEMQEMIDTNERKPSKPSTPKDSRSHDPNLNSLKDFLTTKGHRGSIVNNWTVKAVTRGDNKTIDKYFYSPEGKRFRSRPEVLRYISRK